MRTAHRRARVAAAPPDPGRSRATGWSELARADLTRMADRGRARETLGALVLRAVVHRRFRAVAYFRLAQHLHGRRATRPVAGWLAGRVLGLCAAELAPACLLGPGLALVHTTGLVVGTGVVAGRDLTLHQNVTLGAARGDDGQPRIGDGVVVGAGAKVLGPIRVGDGAIVAANAVVLDDVPPGAVVAGAPARVVGFRDPT